MRKLLTLVTIAGMLTMTACSSPQTTSNETPAPPAATEKANSSEENGASDKPLVEITDPYTFTVAMNVTETTLNYKMMAKFKELIEERSNAKITVNLYTNGQLGNDTEQMQGLIEGSNDFVTTITSGLTSFIPEYAVFDCPNVFPNLETMRAVLDDQAFTDALNAYSEAANVKLMGLADAGFRQTTSNVEIHSADDVKGIKIRVIQNPYHIAYWKSLGANATAMDFSEVYVGLQQKTIDAQENPYMNIVANKFYETQDYVIETNHLGHVIVFLMNQNLYNTLPEQVQTLVDDCAYEAVVYARNLADESIAADKAAIVDSGTTIITLDSAVTDQMKALSSPVYDQIRNDIGNDLVDQLLACVESNRK